jgi:hypothetical protein
MIQGAVILLLSVEQKKGFGEFCPDQVVLDFTPS